MADGSLKVDRQVRWLIRRTGPHMKESILPLSCANHRPRLTVGSQPCCISRMRKSQTPMRSASAVTEPIRKGQILRGHRMPQEAKAGHRKTRGNCQFWHITRPIQAGGLARKRADVEQVSNKENGLKRHLSVRMRSAILRADHWRGNSLSNRS